jgi:hypothetical protein
MSEFKFACPVCGQHITADSSTSGGKIECPTCFRKIVVPQAPTSADGKLIISASQADKPRPPQSEISQLEPLAAPGRSLSLPVVLGVLLVIGGATAFVFRDKLIKAPAEKQTATVKPVPSSPKTVYPVPTNFDWSLELTKAVFPQTVASGRVHGSGFMCERAVLQGGTLTLRQGKGSPPDLGLTIHLFAQQGEELSGKIIEITPDRAPPLPRVVVRWKDPQEKGATQSISHGYALKLAFGDALNGRIPGNIYLSLPDESKTFVAGSFNAEIKKPAPPKPKQPKTPKPPKVKTSG